MPHPSPESAFAVRILHDGKSPRRPAGAGFLVTPQHVVTCAHVVNEALGRKQTAAECPPLPVLLDFPLLHGQPAAQAKLLRWFPVKADAAFGELKDIAILELLPDTPLPTAAQPAPQVLLDGDGRQLSGQQVRMYGFSVPDGTYANGVLQGMTAKGWAEIHHADSGSVDRGFSGAAVWSVRENAVCGMIVSMLSSAASYMIPAVSLFKACPEIDIFSRSLNPYKGLEAFREKDARFYFGRKADAAKLKEKIEKQPFTAVIGASGSGKSSLVFAGLLPLLRQDGGWLCADCKPRHQPFAELAACLVPLLYEDELERVKKSRQCAADLLAGELLLSDLFRRIADRNEHRRFLLIVDQFEELFTLNADSGLRQRFIASLLDAADAEGAAVLLTMRADFLETALGDSCFAKKLNDCPPLLLAPMGDAELKQAAERPAELLGIRFEPGLADMLVAELDSEPGSLPLLEFCLTQLWEQQTFWQISHAACNAIGGVRGALADHADKVLAEFDREEVRRIFLRLVRPGRGTEDTRQVAALAEFQEEQRGLIRQLASRRLLVTSGDEGGQRVEVAHEALIRHWRTLKGWVDEDREFLVWRDKLRVLLRQWQASSHDEGALLRGLPLDEALQWRGSHAGYLGEEELGFVGESEAARKKQRQRRSVAVAAGLLIAAAVAVVFLVLWKDAERQKVVAEQQTLAANYNLAKAFEKEALRSLEKAAKEGAEADKQALLFASAALAQRIELNNSALDPNSTGLLFSSEVFRDSLVELWSSPIVPSQEHLSYVVGLSFTPDGKRLAAAYGTAYPDDNTVWIWDSDSGNRLRVLKENLSAVRSIVFSTDGKRLASVSDEDIRLWDAETGRELMVLQGNFSDSTAFFNSDGSLLTLSSKNTVRFLNPETGKELKAFTLKRDGIVGSVSFRPDGKKLAAEADEATVRIFDIETGNELYVLKTVSGDKYNVGSMDFSPDGRKLAAVYDNAVVRIWNIETGKELTLSPSFRNPVFVVTFSRDGKRLAAASAWENDPDGEIRIWDVETGNLLKVLNRKAGGVNSMAFSPNGKRLASGDTDEVRLWDIGINETQNVLSGHDDNINSVAFSPDGKILASASSDKTVRLWDVKTGGELRNLKGHSDAVTDVAFSPDGKMLASVSADKTVRLWDMKSGKSFSVLTGCSYSTSVSFSTDGNMLASTDNDSVLLWDIKTRKELRNLKGHNEMVIDIAFSHDGKILASASKDKTIRLWDIKNGKEISIFNGHNDTVNSVAFSPDGTMLASASSDETIRLWDVKNGKEISVFKGHNNAVNSIAFSPDGTILASGEKSDHFDYKWDNPVRLWDVKSGRELVRIKGHTDSITSIAFSPDGERLSSASCIYYDGTIRIVDLKPYTLFLYNFQEATPLYHTFIEAVKFLWQLDVQGLEIVHKERTPVDMECFGSLLAPPPPGQSKFDQVLEWAEKQQGGSGKKAD
jgi:WD40 repeat protein/energy-coupling factor transporter ATP-binding protein EcfA2